MEGIGRTSTMTSAIILTDPARMTNVALEMHVPDLMVLSHTNSIGVQAFVMSAMFPIALHFPTI